MQTRASAPEPASPPARSAPAPATLSRGAQFQAPRCADAFPRLCRRLAAGIGQGGSTPPFQPIESHAVPGRRGLESSPGGSAKTQRAPPAREAWPAPALAPRLGCGVGKSFEEQTAPPGEPRLQEPGWEGGRKPAGSALRPARRRWLLLLRHDEAPLRGDDLRKRPG